MDIVLVYHIFFADVTYNLKAVKERIVVTAWLPLKGLSMNTGDVEKPREFN